MWNAQTQRAIIRIFANEYYNLADKKTGNAHII